MFRKIPYTEKEKEIVDKLPGMFGGPDFPVRNTPVSPRENIAALFYDKHPYWMPDIREIRYLHPAVYNNNLGRGFGEDITDAFGVRWKWVAKVGGSIVEPGNPFLESANEWREKIKIPDIDAWDWEGAARENPVDTRYSWCFSFINGFWFERLISFMDFMYAAMALIDDDQVEAVKELFSELTDLGCRLVDKVCKTWPGLDLIEAHDDWGSQKAPFFSREVAEELFVPYMKRFTDRVHAWGRRALLHSCGHTEDRVECYIAAGFDMWAPQDMNDIESLYDKYGDKIVLCVFPKETDLAQRSEEEQRAAARAFADRFCQPGKPAILGLAAAARITPAFQDELYTYSRKLYLSQA